MRRNGLLGLAIGSVAVCAAGSVGQDGPVGVWTTAEELAALPMSGSAWDSLVEFAATPAGRPNLADNSDPTDVLVMAKALAYARGGDPGLREEVIASCMAAIGTEEAGATLAFARNLPAYVIAADLVGLPAAEDQAFRAWLASALDENLKGHTLRSTNELRPNNWGTHAGAARAAIAVYLGDDAELDATATVLRGWLGDREAYSGFEYGELWWQADPSAPVGVNPVGAQIQGHSVDGVLADDQRRSGPFQWPPPQENYVYTALQGTLVQAVILSRRGYDVWNWQDQAVLRAFRWLHLEAAYPAVGDDTWQPHLLNFYYGPCFFPAPVPSQPGKNVGWTDWTHRVCFAEFDQDGSVASGDLIVLLTHWSAPDPCPGDLDGNGGVTLADLLSLLTAWGACQ